jgi:predicted YcjX-like family ATPase
MRQWLHPLSPVTHGVKKNFDEALNRTLDRSVRLAVTGLSRSGKTVFITSLVHQLIHGMNNDHLPFFELVNNDRLQGVKQQPQPDLHIPTFRYDLSLDSLMADPPAWPEPTSSISEIRLAIRYQPQNTLLRYFAPVNTLYLDIIDYPGEWLLDLPLLDLSYEQWSAQIMALCDQAPRLALSQAWRMFMDSLDLLAPTKETQLRQASELYTEFLHCCHDKQYGLTLLQPGRFTMPGDLKGAPLLEFCPLLKIPAHGHKATDSFYATMKQRYESYKEHVVRKFYKDHFCQFDRQIVLVDVLRAFNTGYATFKDMQAAIELVLKSFHYGKSNLFNRLFNVKIDKLLFAATKADHITPNQLPNLERFLVQMLAQSNNNIKFEGVKTETVALSALKCTQAANTEFQGQQISCIKGIPKHSDKPVALFPGEVPVDIPVPEDWLQDRFNFIDFRPPAASQWQNNRLPHMRMDRALQFLLGDKF